MPHREPVYNVKLYPDRDTMMPVELSVVAHSKETVEKYLEHHGLLGCCEYIRKAHYKVLLLTDVPKVMGKCPVKKHSPATQEEIDSYHKRRHEYYMYSFGKGYQPS